MLAGRRERAKRERTTGTKTLAPMAHGYNGGKLARESAAYRERRLGVGLGLTEADDFVAVLELTALAEHLDTLEALEDVSFRGDGAGAFETTVLGHG